MPTSTMLCCRSSMDLTHQKASNVIKNQTRAYRHTKLRQSLEENKKFKVKDQQRQIDHVAQSKT